MAALAQIVAGILVWGALVAPGGDAVAGGSAAIPLNECVSSDNGDPVLTGLTLTPSVDVTDAAQEVAFSLTAEDLGGPGPASGVRGVEIAFFGEPLVEDPFDSIQVLHKDASGAWVGAKVVERGSSPGALRVHHVYLRDRAGNRRFVDTTELERAGFATSVEVVSTPDTTRPRLVAFRSTPGPVDTRWASRVVTFTATVVDAVPGVGELYLWGGMRGASISEKSYDGDYVGFSPVPGSPDTFRASMRVRRWVGSGTWKIDRVAMVDKVGNYRSYSYKRLGELGFRRQLAIVSGVDTGRPALARLALSPGRVDVRTQDGRGRGDGSCHRRPFGGLAGDRHRGAQAPRAREDLRDPPGRRVGGHAGAAALHDERRCAAGQRRRRRREPERGVLRAISPRVPRLVEGAECHSGGPSSSAGESCGLADRPGCAGPAALLRGRLRLHVRERDRTPGLRAVRRSSDLRAGPPGILGVPEGER